MSVQDCKNTLGATHILAMPDKLQVRVRRQPSQKADWFVVIASQYLGQDI